MVSEQHDTTGDVTHEPDPAALSFVGGFIGTVTGFERANVPGAVVGGFVGGTVGYLAGASSSGVDPTSDSGRAEPILIDVGDADSGASTEDGSVGDDADDHDETEEGDAGETGEDSAS